MEAPFKIEVAAGELESFAGHGYGGDMDNHVVVACCKALRGVGRSDGSYDEGRGERDDAYAAVSALRTGQPEARVLLVGYSFGAMVAASIADEALAGLVLISPPTAMAPLAAFPSAVPVLLAAGDRDQVSPFENLKSVESESVQVVVFKGVDHGWWPGIDELAESIRSFAVSLLGIRR